MPRTCGLINKICHHVYLLEFTEISGIARFLLKNRDYLKGRVIFTMNRPQSDPDKLKRIVRNSYLLLPSIIGKDWDQVE